MARLLLRPVDRRWHSSEEVQGPEQLRDMAEPFARRSFDLLHVMVSAMSTAS